MRSPRNPVRFSPRYRALIALYRQMHVEGERILRIPPEKTYAGRSLPPHVVPIRKLIRRFDARTILDYGSGKGAHYARRNIKLPEGQCVDTLASFWEVDQITCYDPAYVPFSDLPTSRFDGVICTDVFEHCPEEDVPWIVDEVFSFSRKFVYANVACYPAKQSLPSGENAHCTIRPPTWWETVLVDIAPRYPEVRYVFSFEVRGRNFFGLKTRKALQLSG